MNDMPQPIGRPRGSEGYRGSSIILIGLMGTGKTTVGRILAREMRAVHIDSDSEIERIESMTVSQIFAEKGEQYFRDAETKFLRRIYRRRPSRRLILSTGGGLPLRPENADLLRKLGTVIWLRADPETLVKRVERKIAVRPLLHNDEISLIDRMTRLCLERNTIYHSLADHIFDTEQEVHASILAASVLEICV
jgi:shikimate kinase